MSFSKRALACVALLFVAALFSTNAFGDLLKPDGTPYYPAYTDVSGTTWYGTAYYDHENGLFAGAIDYAVFGPGAFPYADSGYVPASNLYTYVYQIRNTGIGALSDFTFSVDQAVGNIGSFVSLGQVEGVQPGSIDFASGEGGFVEWIYTQNAINSGGMSAGLVFTSPKAPTTTTTGSVTNSGDTCGVDALPTPGPNDIPEPNTLVLLAFGLGLLGLRRYVQR